MLRKLLTRVVAWAAGRDDVLAVALVGSQARGTARPDSDVDLVVLAEDPAPYLREGVGHYCAAGLTRRGRASPVASAAAPTLAPVPANPLIASPTGMPDPRRVAGHRGSGIPAWPAVARVCRALDRPIVVRVSPGNA